METDTKKPEPLSVAFCLAVDIAKVLKVPPLNTMDKPWELKLDDAWYIAVNGTKQSHVVTPIDCMEATVNRFDMAVWRNGWLMGLLNPVQGIFIGTGEEEDNFIRAMLTRLEKEYGGIDKFPEDVREIYDTHH